MLQSWRSAVLLATLAATAASACASQAPFYRQGPVRAVDERAYEYGFDEGRQRGADDARARRPFEYERHRAFRNADEGYRGYGDRNTYRALYREGFAAGYTDAYRRYGSAARGPAVRPGPAFVSPAAANGYRDGFDQGREDRRDRKRFDPVRAPRYRAGDHDYDRRHGSRDGYKRDYRAAFMQGYEQGYRVG